MDGFLQDLDEDVEVMQSTIYFLQNELKKNKASVQNTDDSANKETNSKAVFNGMKQDNVISKETPSISKTETSTQIVLTKSDIKSSKHSKSKDSKHLNDSKSNQSKQKKSRPAVETDNTDHSGKISKIHKSKHKSDGSKSDQESIKSEKRSHNKDKVVLKKPKSDQTKSIEVPTAVTTIINGLPNGS